MISAYFVEWKKPKKRNFNCVWSPQLSRPCAESARAVTGRWGPPVECWPVSFLQKGCNSETKSRKINPKKQNGPPFEGLTNHWKNLWSYSKKGFSGQNSSSWAQIGQILFRTGGKSWKIKPSGHSRATHVDHFPHPGEIDPNVRCVPKKRTFRMLLEPQCTGSITICRHLLCLEVDFLVVSYKD